MISLTLAVTEINVSIEDAISVALKMDSDVFVSIVVIPRNFLRAGSAALQKDTNANAPHAPISTDGLAETKPLASLAPTCRGCVSTGLLEGYHHILPVWPHVANDEREKTVNTTETRERYLGHL